MKNLEFTRNLALGQYVDSGSPVHRLRPSTKYLLLLLAMLPALASPTPFGPALVFVAVALASRASRVPASFIFKGLRPALPLFVLIALFQFPFTMSNDHSLVLFTLGPVTGTLREAWAALLVAGRTVAMILLVSLFTSVTAEGEVARGIEDLLLPLARLGLPVRPLALAVTTALRFVPIILGELEAIVKAQASRGADFGSSRGGPLRRARAWLPLFVPVVVRALERAELLAEAMEARGYTDEGRSRYILYPKAPGEDLIRLIALLFAAGALALDYGYFGPLARALLESR